MVQNINNLVPHLGSYVSYVGSSLSDEQEHGEFPSSRYGVVWYKLEFTLAHYICQISLTTGVATISTLWVPADIAQPFGTISRA